SNSAPAVYRPRKEAPSPGPGIERAVPVSMDEFEQAGRAHAAADAHRDHAELRLSAPTFQKNVSGHPRARHAVRMTDGNGATIHVQFLVRDSEAAHAVKHLARESFVQFPKIDIVGFESVTLEQARNGKHRTDAHFVGFAATDGETAKYAQRSEILAFGNFGVHEDAGRGAIGKLRGVSCRDVLA